MYKMFLKAWSGEKQYGIGFQGFDRQIFFIIFFLCFIHDFLAKACYPALLFS